MATSTWNVVWITGGSSGIGCELARLCAQQGAKVAVTSRASDKLDALADSSDNIYAYPGDVTDRAGMSDVVQRIEADLGPIDLAVFSAGVWKPMGAKEFDADAFQRIMDVNYIGVINCMAPLIPAMTDRGRGHIAPIASVASYRGLPKSAAYGASKSAVVHVAESLQPELKRRGVTMSVVNPGFVDTPMTEVNDFDMPYMIDARTAAEKTLRGLKRKKFEIAYPWPMVLQLKLARILPYPIFFWLIRTFIAPSKS